MLVIFSNINNNNFYHIINKKYNISVNNVYVSEIEIYTKSINQKNIPKKYFLIICS